MRRKLREKYFKGLCSEEYMKTGVPVIEREREEQIQKDIREQKKLLLENAKIANKCQTRGYKKKRAIEERLIFV